MSKAFDTEHSLAPNLQLDLHTKLQTILSQSNRLAQYPVP